MQKRCSVDEAVAFAATEDMDRQNCATARGWCNYSLIVEVVASLVFVRLLGLLRTIIIPIVHAKHLIGVGLIAPTDIIWCDLSRYLHWLSFPICLAISKEIAPPLPHQLHHHEP